MSSLNCDVQQHVKFRGALRVAVACPTVNRIIQKVFDRFGRKFLDGCSKGSATSRLNSEQPAPRGTILSSLTLHHYVCPQYMAYSEFGMTTSREKCKLLGG